MTQQFKLLYRGAIAPDQHQAVVRGKLQALLKISDEQTQVMFSGKPVIVKKSADQPTADRYRGAFAKAGAVLEVIAAPIDGDEAAKSTADPAPSVAVRTADEPAFALAAVGADLLGPNERSQVAPVEVSTDHLSLGFPGQDIGSDAPPGPTPPVPSTDHLELDALGVDLGDAVEQSIESALLTVDFDLAEVGAPLVERTPAAQPPAPDTSHLSLADAEALTDAPD